MKRILAVIFVLSLIFVFASCNSETETDNTTATDNDTTAFVEVSSVSVQDIMNEIENKGYLPENPVKLTKNDLLDYYGIEPSDVKDCAVVQNPSGYQDEIIIIEAVDENAKATVKGILEDQINYKRDQMMNYDAEMFDILSDCHVITNGNYVALFISAEREAIGTIFNSYFIG